MLQKICLYISLLAFCSTALIAEGNGSFSGAFLRIGLGARAMAMGNAQVANATNGYGIYYNPAGLPRLEKKELALSYSDMSLDRKLNYVGFALPLKPFAGAAVGWINSGVGNLRSYNSSGEDTGELDHGLNAIYGAFSVNIISLVQADGNLQNVKSDLISIGLAVKFLREAIDDNEGFDYSGSGFGIDAGLMIKPHDKFMLGYQLKDLNASLASNTNDIFERGSDIDNAFPVSQRVGMFYETPFKGLAIAYDFEWSDKGEEKHHVGAEMVFSMGAGRIGYDNDHFTLGGGLSFEGRKGWGMKLDYAYVDSVIDEGISHVFSWRFLF